MSFAIGASLNHGNSENGTKSSSVSSISQKPWFETFVTSTSKVLVPGIAKKRNPPSRKTVGRIKMDCSLSSVPVRATAGDVSLVASSMCFSETPLKHEVPPPVLGQHTDEILRKVLKKSDAETAKLK